MEWTREVYVSVVEHWVFSKLLTLAKAFLLPKEQDTTNTVREFTTVQADVISKNIVPPPPNGQFFLVQRGPSKCLGEARTQFLVFLKTNHCEGLNLSSGLLVPAVMSTCLDEAIPASQRRDVVAGCKKM